MLELEAKDTLTPVELNRGEGFTFKLRGGGVRKLVLEDTAADVLLTSCADPRVEEPDGGTLYHFTCRVRIDGHPMTMERYVCSQESFYEPYVVNGMRIWFDGVQDIFDFTMENHGPCRPNRHARFAVQDATLPICPQGMQPWCPTDGNFIDVAGCYNGDDPWMGPYLGGTAHGGMDINHPRGTPLWAPIDLDDQFYFNCVSRGANNNRWWGIRHWPDGSDWMIGTYHVVRLLVPEHTPIPAGTHYAEAAGVWVGSHDHTHFYFMIKERGRIFRLDPWILFWQIFENNRRHGNPHAAVGQQAFTRETVADIAPLGPAKTGQPVAFSSAGTQAGRRAKGLTYCWTFGDGGTSAEENPTHTFTTPGIYPATLTVDDGRTLATRTQHITVDGDPVDVPALVLTAPDEPSFRPRPVHLMDAYGVPPKRTPHTLAFTARPGSRPAPNARTVRAEGGEVAIECADAPAWITVVVSGAEITVSVDATGLAPGTYAASLEVACEGALNSPQGFRVLLNVPAQRPKAQVTVDDRDPGFCCTPWFWVGPRFNHWKELGDGGRYLTNGARAREGEFARFTPDLRAGRYEVSFSDRTPFREGTRFAVRIRHAGGEDTVWVEPARSLGIGTFDFAEGTDGFVELLAGGSRGQVMADAVVFRPAGGD